MTLVQPRASSSLLPSMRRWYGPGSAAELYGPGGRRSVSEYPQSPFHSQQPSNAVQQQQQQQQQQGNSQPSDHQSQTVQPMRLRQDPPPVNTPAARSSRKRKSPTEGLEQQQSLPPPPPQPTMQHPLPPPHTLVPPHLQAPPPGMSPFQYPPDYSTGGLPPPHPMHAVPQPPPEAPVSPDQQQPGSTQNSANQGRTLSQSKRAEQNRKAQRAFRERRDQHVKALESRSQLLDAALASADEANRRWEECRALVDQLRIENAALRAALSQAQSANAPPTGASPSETKSGELGDKGEDKSD